LLIRVCARSEELDSSEELYAQLRLLGGQKVFLLVVITEQRRFLGAVQHLQLSNLIFYVCQEGSRDLTDAVRFGMDYSYAAVTFGQHSLEAAKTVSPLSPALQASSLRKSLDQSHRHWLKRDSRGLSPTSDINGCFEKGPDQFFPGRFHKTTAFEPSPHYAQHLEMKVLHASGEELARLAASLAQTPQLDVNAWDGQGETLLHKAARRGQPEILAPLLLMAADPNCRAKDGRCPLDCIPKGPGGDLARSLLMMAGGE
ncbi:desi2, partial [Symbiodinium necroappetens]